MSATDATIAVDLPAARRLGGFLARSVVWGALAVGAVYVGLAGPNAATHATVAAIYVVVGLSLNVIIGYTGQLSLGHQGFVGAGALFAAYTTTRAGFPFPFALATAVVAGALFALLIGFVALRVRGLYLALITLVFGLALQSSLFQAPAFTGGGAGEPANRPAVLLSPDRFYFVCLALAIVVLYLDFRLMRSKAGRALLTVKEDERVAGAYGINVVGYKLLAFVFSGAVAGLAGGLLAFSSQQFNGNSYTFQLALTFVLMTVVGGAGSRAGVVVGSILFALLHDFLATFGPFISFSKLFPGQIATNMQQFGPDLIGALLLLLTLALNPDGMAQFVDPIVGWMTGGRLDRSRLLPTRGTPGGAHVRP